MPSKNEETKLQTDPSDQQNKILSELQQLPLPPLQPAAEPQKLNPLENRRDDSDSITAVAARDPITTSPSLDSIINDFENSLSFLDYDPILNPGGEEFDDDEDEDEELRSYDAEEVFFTKFLNQKYITRGYKRQPVKNKNLRAETRRKYLHFRQVQKKQDEKHRKNEKYTYDCLPPPFSNSSPNTTTTTTTPLSQIGSSENGSNPATTTTTQSSPPIGNTSAAATTTPGSDPFGAAAAAAAEAAKYLTLQAERDYLEAVRQSSVDLTPTTGLSMQQMLDMCNRDLTPEDYELLLRLDEAVAKKTVKQETLTNLMEQIIDKEAQLAEVCTVCMFNYELGDRAKYLPCNHFFHVDCIVPYLSSYGQSCPVCKSKV
jgi:hypothetical protein